MIRTVLQEAAVSVAKAYSHAEVDRRHVLFAIARQFRAHPEVGRRFHTTKQALEPHGHAHGLPSISQEAATLLESLSSEDAAIAALVAALGPVDELGGGRDTGAQAQQQPAQAVTASRTGTSPSPGAVETTSDVLKELDGLIGLGPVKAQVRNIIAVVQANTERMKAGLAPVNPSLHLVFTGPPGTGKTTVARLMARLYASTGALPGSRFTEATRADLVAGYVGQTAMKTAELIENTRPGVLFVDEAYALTPRASADFGYEAIATMVKAMEDHRSDFAVIVAGYGDEMSEFVGSNPGLRSRFRNYIDFPDFTAPELTRIFTQFAKDSGIAVANGVTEKAERIFTQAVQKRDFGNARFARSLFEQAYARMAARAAADGVVTVDELQTLSPEDLELDLEIVRQGSRRIGFHKGDADQDPTGG